MNKRSCKGWASPAVYASLLLIIGPVTALALVFHSLHLDIWVDEGATILGEAYYHEGKAAGAKVEVFAPDGGKLGETKTDDEGAFGFEAEFYCDHKFVVTHAGHRATAVIPAEDLPEDLPAY